MTPHLKEHPWTPIAKDLTRLTGRRGITYTFFDSEHIDVHEFFAAIDDIAGGKVEVSRRFLAVLIDQIRCQERFGLDDTQIVTEAPKALPRHELKDASAPLWSELIRRNLVEIPNVRFKD